MKTLRAIWNWVKAGSAILWLPVIAAIAYKTWIPIELAGIVAIIVLPASFTYHFLESRNRKV